MFNLSPAIAAVDWAFSGTVVLVGLVVVFAVLLILVAFCSITGKIFSSTGKDNKKKADVAPAAPAKSAAAPAPVVEDGIEDEVVAAISAAIACIMGEGVPFTVKSISRKKTAASASGRPVWSAAGIAESTRPF